MVGFHDGGDQFGKFILNIYIVIYVAESFVVLSGRCRSGVCNRPYPLLISSGIFLCSSRVLYFQRPIFRFTLAGPDTLISLSTASKTRFVTDFRGLTFTCNTISQNPTTYNCAFVGSLNSQGMFTGEDVLAFYGYEDVDYWEWFGIMIAILVVVRFSFFAVLAYNSKPKVAVS